MKKAIMIGLGLLTGAVALAAVTSEQNIKVDNIVIGRPSPAADPQISFKGATTKIKANRTTSKLQFTNDGSTYKNLGSGSGGAGGTNLLADDNFDFEVGTPFTGWTASGGTVTAETTNPLFDDKSLIWDASALNQTLTSVTKTIKAGMVGRSCQAEIYYKWPSGVAGDLSLEARDGTPATLATIALNPTTGNNVTRAQLQFDCPALAGTLTLRLLSNVADPAIITIDNAFIGSGNSTFNMAQTELFGAVVYNNVANCEVSTTSGTVAEVADDADCSSRQIVGQASFVNNQFKMRFANGLPAGRYELTTMVPAYVTGASTACEFYIQSTTGVGSNMPTQYAVIDTAGNALSNPRAQTVNIAWTQATPTTGAIDFFMEWRRTSGAGTCFMGTAQAGGATFSMSLKKYPTTSSEAITLETSGWKVDANIGGSNPSLGVGAVTVYSPVEDAGLDLVNNSGSGNIAAQIPCSGTNPPTGLTCAAGNESIGVSLNAPYAGDVLACATFAQEISTAASGSVTSAFQLVETAANSQTILQEGKSRIQTQNRQPSVIVNQPVRVCGNFTFASAGQKTIRLNYEQSFVATVSSNIILADRNTNNGQRDIHWEVYPINQQMPAPVFTALQNNVKSVQNGEKIVRARINNNGAACPIVHQTGAWISSVARSGTGVCAITIAGGVFSGAPACVVLSTGGAADVANQGAVTPSATAVTVSTFVSTTGAANDKAFDIICMGPN